MDCRTSQPMLETYIDNELARGDARELERHLDVCADCRAALTRLDSLRRSLRQTSLRYAAPAALRERIAGAVHRDGMAESAAAAAPARRHPPRASAWRMAAACVLAFGAGTLTTQLWHSSAESDLAESSLAHDLFASHWRALAAASPVDVVSTDRHTVKPWFAGKVAQAPVVQDFADRGFALVGGRIDYVGTQRVPVLVYRHGQHLIDLFVLPPASALSPAQQHGYSLDAVTLGDQPAAVVSDMDRQELARFEQLLAEERSR